MRIELILLGLGIVALGWLKRQSREDQRQRGRTESGRSNEERGTWRAGRRQSPPEREPQADSVRFNETPGGPSVNEGSRDAFTGEQLARNVKIFQCQTCRSFYHEASLALLRRENRGRCIACGGQEILRDTIAEAELSTDPS